MGTLLETAREVLKRFRSFGRRKGPKIMSRVWTFLGRKVRRGMTTYERTSKMIDCQLNMMAAVREA